jgi:hypothetical protein
MKKRLKSLEERKRDWEELGKEVAERKMLVNFLLDAFDKSLEKMYKDTGILDDERLSPTEEIEAKDEFEKWLKELSTRSLREMKAEVSKSGVSIHIIHWIWETFYEEEAEEEE